MDAGVISAQHEMPFVTNPLSVSVFIFDIREVNIHIWTKSVKYDDLTALLYE